MVRPYARTDVRSGGFRVVPAVLPSRAPGHERPDRLHGLTANLRTGSRRRTQNQRHPPIRTIGRSPPIRRRAQISWKRTRVPIPPIRTRGRSPPIRRRTQISWKQRKEMNESHWHQFDRLPPGAVNMSCRSPAPSPLPPLRNPSRHSWYGTSQVGRSITNTRSVPSDCGRPHARRGRNPAPVSCHAPTANTERAQPGASARDPRSARAGV